MKTKLIKEMYCKQLNVKEDAVKCAFVYSMGEEESYCLTDYPVVDEKVNVRISIITIKMETTMEIIDP